MTNSNLPGHASVVVIGGGVMGCSTLYHLAKQGVSDAVLIERNKLTSGTTWHSAAQVRCLRSSRNLTELIRYSISLYSQLEEETGQATGWINKGSLSITTSEDRMIHTRRQEALAHLFGIQADWISAGEAKERWPLMNVDDVLGAVFSPEDGRVSPSDLCAALVKGARTRGAKIFEDTGVTGILTKGGKVVGVETSAGTITCDAVAVCSGLWSRKTAGLAGVGAPVWPCEHFYLLTKPVDGISGNMPTLADHDAHLYIRDDSGGLLIGCFEPMGKAISPEQLGEDFAFQLLPEDWDHFEPMMMNALHRLPVLETAEVKMLLNGPESFTPDSAFMLGEAAETRGLFLGCGMNSMGVASGGGAGMALAHCIVRGHTPTDLHEADPKRFPDCYNSVEALTARAPEVLGKHYEITYPGRSYSSARALRKGPLHEHWLAEKAHFGQVYGWERPVYFGKTEEPALTFGRPAWFDHVANEVRHAHEGAAIFDQSSFGKIRVTGADAEVFLNRVCANTLSRAPGRAIYTGLLNERGGFESDLTALRFGAEDYRLYVGTAAIRRDMAWLRRHLRDDERVTLHDETEEFAVIGLMGPKAAQIAKDVGAGALNDLKFFTHAETEIAGKAVRGVRLSYVGEAGWELTATAADAPAIYEALSAAGARPAGTLAQTSMRIEKRFLSYGHDLDTDVTPLEAGLEFAVDWSKDFIGKTALLKRKEAGISSTMVSVILDDSNAVPLGNEPIYQGNDIIGQTTSAAFGYRVGKPVALAFVKANRLDDALNGPVNVDIARTLFKGQVSQKPAYGG